MDVNAHTEELEVSRRRFVQTSAGLLGAVASASRARADPGRSISAVVSADLSATMCRFDRMLFGQFLEHFHHQVYGGVFDPGSKFSDQQGFRKDVIAAMRELQVPVVRWPGGCFVSAYHWKNGVGKNRVPSYDKAWKVEDPNTFGTDEFVTWCRKIGAEPYICTNAGTGTPEEMSDWVEYCNLKNEGQYAKMRVAGGFPEPHNVRFWSIGNENYGSWEAGAKTIEQWGYFVRESAKLMRMVDPSIKLFAAATADRDWTIPLLRRAGQYLDYISIHGYWDRLTEVNDLNDFPTCMIRSVEPEAQIVRTVQILEETGLKDKIKIAFDEWNARAWHHPGHRPIRKSPELTKARDKNALASTYTMADACFSACFLNACLRQAEHVQMANMAPAVNTRGPLFVHSEGIVKRTTFHVLKMYADLLEPNVVASAKVTSDPFSHGERSVPSVDVVVTCGNDRKRLAVAIVNRHPDKQADCRLAIKDLPREVEAEVTILAGDSPDAYNDVDLPGRVVPQRQRRIILDGRISLSPHSVTIARFSPPFSQQKPIPRIQLSRRSARDRGTYRREPRRGSG